MSHPFPPHECGGEGVGQGRGRERDKSGTRPGRGLHRLLLGLILEKMLLEDAALPSWSREFGCPCEEGAGTPKFLRWALTMVLGMHLALKLFLLHLSGILGLNLGDTSLTLVPSD